MPITDIPARVRALRDTIQEMRALDREEELSADSRRQLKENLHEVERQLRSLTCCFAHAGTYGHECGKAASHVGVKKSDITKSGLYFARRCPECMTIKGGENSNVIRFEVLDPDQHRNVFK